MQLRHLLYPPDITAELGHGCSRCLKFRKMLSEDQFIAASIGDIEWLQQSISKGKVKYDKNGMSALHLAAMNGHLDCVEDLIEEYDFDVDLTTQDGSTPLHFAINKEAGSCSTACVFYLLDKGANPSIQNEEGTTPLHVAAGQGHLAILQILLDWGAKVDCKDNKGHLPYDLAQTWGHERCGKILRANMWHKDKKHIAKQMRQLQDIKYQLLSREKINKSQKETNGKPKQQQNQMCSTEEDISDATKFKSRFQTPIIQAGYTPTSGTDGKKKCKSLSKPKQIWKPFTRGCTPTYIPNLQDQYPRDPYTLMPISENETKYFDGKHRPDSVCLKTSFTEDDPIDFQLPDLPNDIIAKVLAPDPTQFERPLVFKCKNILDLPARWRPSNLPKDEISHHLSSDTRSIIFQNSLQPDTKFLVVQNKEHLQK